MSQTSYHEAVVRGIEEETNALEKIVRAPRVLGDELGSAIRPVLRRLEFLSSQGWNWSAENPETPRFVRWLNLLGETRKLVMDKVELARSDVWAFRNIDHDLWPLMYGIRPCLVEIYHKTNEESLPLLKDYLDALSYEGYDSEHCPEADGPSPNSDALYEYHGDIETSRARRRAAAAEYILARRFLREIGREEEFVDYLEKAMASGEHKYPELVDMEWLSTPRI